VKPNLLVRLAVTASVALARSGAAAPTIDECLANLRKGPDTFVAYLCLGTPGLPERPIEVRKILQEVLRRSPGEPHARVYLALMRVYAEDALAVDKREFTEPLATFERRQLWPDVFLAQLALLERTCISGTHAIEECRGLGPLLERSDGLARRIGDPDLIRLALVARMRWSMETHSMSRGLPAAKELERMTGSPAGWLKVLEVSTRALFARQLGDDLTARDLYRNLVSVTPSGTISHTAAVAGVAATTGQLALDGLADRAEAERLLRIALEEQTRQHLVDYNSPDIGVFWTRALLASLLGRTPETVSWISENDNGALAVELLLQGSEAERADAVRRAHRKLIESSSEGTAWLFSLAHAEFSAGSPSEAILWADRAIASAESRRDAEEDDAIRLRANARRGIIYQAYISDLLDTRPEDPLHLEKAWEVLERLRARVLLERLLDRDSSEGRPAAPIATLRDVRHALREDEAMVSFFVWAPQPTPQAPWTRGHSYALVVTRTAVHAIRVPPGTELEPAVKAWTRLVESHSSGIEPGSRRLFAELIKPVLDLLPPEVHSLVLIPDGPLHRLPFDALSETGIRPYLVERYAITIVPSASVWSRLRKRTPTPPGIALAFANTPEGPAVTAAETRGDVVPGQLAPLLHAREEAAEAVDSFPAGSKLFVGADATPERLVAGDLHRASLVHFAAHGVANQKEPDESFLLLAPDTGGSGKLRVSDIPRFDWSGKTVVLSACDTSVGALRIGEGVLSIARGFFAGGASTVIGTLSQVRDDDQRALFRAFYSELRRGVSVGDALVLAKRALIRNGAPPASWANVIVLGDATVRPRAPDPTWPRWAVLGGSVAGLAVLVLGLSARRRSRTATSA
jgi:CHAT domain-containing protein